MPSSYRIKDLNPDGRGRVLESGRSVLVHQALPDEEVTLRLDKQTRGTLQGRVERMLTPRPDRIRHACPHEFVCTGCPLLAASPQLESDFKTQRILGPLREALGEQCPTSIHIERPSELFGYRHYTKQIATRHQGDFSFGSYVLGTHGVTPNDDCPVLAPDLARLVKNVTTACRSHKARPSTQTQPGIHHLTLRLSQATGQSVLMLAADTQAAELAGDVVRHSDGITSGYVLVTDASTNNLMAGELRHVHGPAHMTDCMLNFEHAIGPRTFFQINPTAARVLFGHALRMAGSGEHCLEGYAGVGALTLPLGRQFDRVTAIEENAESVAALNETLTRYEKEQAIKGVCAPTEKALETAVEEQTSCMVLDPPRKGLHQHAAAFAQSGVQRIILLSCEPSSLARDAEKLCNHYRLAELVAVDQFPRTAHVETVARFERKN